MFPPKPSRVYLTSSPFLFISLLHFWACQKRERVCVWKQSNRLEFTPCSLAFSAAEELLFLCWGKNLSGSSSLETRVLPLRADLLFLLGLEWSHCPFPGFEWSCCPSGSSLPFSQTFLICFHPECYNCSAHLTSLSNFLLKPLYALFLLLFSFCLLLFSVCKF